MVVEKHVAAAVVGMDVVEKEVERSCVEVTAEIGEGSLQAVVRDLGGDDLA